MKADEREFRRYSENRGTGIELFKQNRIKEVF